MPRMENKHRKATKFHNYYVYKAICGQFESKIVVRIPTSLGYVSRQKWTPTKSEDCGTRSATLELYTAEELRIRGLGASWSSLLSTKLNSKIGSVIERKS
ncbi:hypothetical protein AABB24_014628 [Solanum stoloniferum]|uniref:Uncharacterized protein n=1 Tax=Solanum stoloniferum TaxID=62892 RepID=A0ABD2U002_9SOLN